MQTPLKRTSVGKIKSKGISDEETLTAAVKPQDERLKKTLHSEATPRNFVQKSSTSDIYGQIKKGAVQSVKAPKKLQGTSRISSNVSPMKDLLKSSPSASQLRAKSTYDKTPKVSQKKVEAKTPLDSARKNATPRTAKDLPFVNVTVNSPVAKRKLNLNKEHEKDLKKYVRKVDSFEKKSKEVKQPRSLERGDFREVRPPKKLPPHKGDTEEFDKIATRQRTKTRTLNEDEVKVLTPDVVDNNAEMLSLSRKLSAKPKAFYIDLDGDKEKVQSKNEKSSDEEVSYEDDFESYESDFESYHSDPSPSEHSSSGEQNGEENGEHVDSFEEGSSKEIKDEENMMDSGSFDLRESQRSANRSKPAVMDFILEDGEDTSADKRTSLTDEGFQEMSSSSAVSSMRTVHVDILDRPLFIDFTKSKENKRKRRIMENLKQRAKDLLSVITLHEMSYILFEMKPIPYDLYMATFGRSNYTQIAVQTFDDGITEETQTEEILEDIKWTQHPIEFSNHDIYMNKKQISKKYGKNDEDYLSKFSFLINKNSDVSINNKKNINKDYMSNSLRLYLEQKDGVGSGEMLPYESYKSKLRNNNYNVNKLRKFLKKVESRVSHVLSTNSGSGYLSDTIPSKLPFSKDYVSMSPNNINDEILSFVKNAKITGLLFSETKSNLIITIHRKSSNGLTSERCIICLWDISVASRKPFKVLVAIDNVALGKFRGSTDGIFVAALEDGSIHIWDLSEEPTWRHVASNEKTTNLEEIDESRLTQTEIDREWNLKNRNVGCEQAILQCALQACAYTTSADNVKNGDVVDCVVGVEFVGDAHAPVSQDGGRKIVGQVCSLQRIGILTIWSLVQEKSKTVLDVGKAFSSKMKLEKSQTISLLDYFDTPSKDITENEISFNLNAAKRRLCSRKQEKNAIKKDFSRPKSAISSDIDFDIDRPSSAASSKAKTVLLADKKITQSWESGLLCSDLKIMKLNKIDNYLIAKNCGEVLCCTRSAGVFKINKFCVATDTSSVTCLEVSPHGLPYFLAGTDSGTVNLCSIVDARVLLTLDTQNGPVAEMPDKVHSDHKGRYVSGVTSRSPAHESGTRVGSKIAISSVQWSRSNPCRIFTLRRDCTLAMWDLTRSDISAGCACVHAGVACAHGDGTLALLTADGELQVHMLGDEKRNTHYVELFNKYVTLL